MAKSGKTSESQQRTADLCQADAELELLGEELIREARATQSDFVAGWEAFMKQLGIQGQPIGAKKLREMLLQQGIDPEANEFSREIIAMREE